MSDMLEVILVGNLEAGRLEAEVRNERYDLVAVVYQDNNAGWHVQEHGSEKLPADFLCKIKDKLSSHPNRKGNDAPEGLTQGEYSLWLLE